MDRVDRPLMDDAVEVGKRALELSAARNAENRAARERDERAWLGGRFKIGERVSMTVDAGPRFYQEDQDGTLVLRERTPMVGARWYGRVVDVHFDAQDPRAERYAVQWDGGSLTWVNGREKLRRVAER